MWGDSASWSIKCMGIWDSKEVEKSHLEVWYVNLLDFPSCVIEGNYCQKISIDHAIIVEIEWVYSMVQEASVGYKTAEDRY